MAGIFFFLLKKKERKKNLCPYLRTFACTTARFWIPDQPRPPEMKDEKKRIRCLVSLALDNKHFQLRDMARTLEKPLQQSSNTFIHHSLRTIIHSAAQEFSSKLG